MASFSPGHFLIWEPKYVRESTCIHCVHIQGRNHGHSITEYWKYHSIMSAIFYETRSESLSLAHTRREISATSWGEECQKFGSKRIFKTSPLSLRQRLQSQNPYSVIALVLCDVTISPYSTLTTLFCSRAEPHIYQIATV